MDIDNKTGPCYTCLKRLNHHFQPLFLAKKRIRVPVREGPNYVLRLFLRKSKIENRSHECIRHKTATLKITSFSLSLDIPTSMHICYSPVGRPGLGETVPEVLSNALGLRPRAVLRPRAQFLPIWSDLGRWITFLFFSYYDLKVSGKFSFTLQLMLVEVRRVRVDEARDRLQTKTNITTWFLAR